MAYSIRKAGAGALAKFSEKNKVIRETVKKCFRDNEKCQATLIK